MSVARAYALPKVRGSKSGNSTRFSPGDHDLKGGLLESEFEHSPLPRCPANLSARQTPPVTIYARHAVIVGSLLTICLNGPLSTTRELSEKGASSRVSLLSTYSCPQLSVRSSTNLAGVFDRSKEVGQFSSFSKMPYICHLSQPALSTRYCRFVPS